MDLYLGDQRVRYLHNLIHAHGDNDLAMVTLTAPGADLLPWDKSHCAALGDHDCSGRLGCRVHPAAAREFNEQALARLSKLWGAVYARVYRRHGADALNLLAYAPEPQKRGVIHYHLLLDISTARRLAAAHEAWEAMKRLSTVYGWGFVNQKWEPSGVAKGVRYCAKYLSKRAEDGHSCREMLVRGQMARRSFYVASRLTQRTGCTMRNLRMRRVLFNAWGGPALPIEEVAAIARLRAAFPALSITQDGLEAPDRAPPREWVPPWRRPELVHRQGALGEAPLPLRRRS